MSSDRWHRYTVIVGMHDGNSSILYYELFWLSDKDVDNIIGIVTAANTECGVLP